jgi:chaperonin GroES
MSSLTMFKDRILIRRATAPTTVGSIYLPETARGEQQLKGTVVAVGADVPCCDGSKFPLDVQPGDFVLLGDYGGVSVEFEGEDLIVTTDQNIVAVFRVSIIID